MTRTVNRTTTKPSKRTNTGTDLPPALLTVSAASPATSYASGHAPATPRAPSAMIDPLTLHPAEQARLLIEILQMMVGIEAVSSIGGVWPPDTELVEAVVRFGHAWPGAMVFSSTLPLSYQFTARFMSLPLPEAVNEDVCDAFGELANMIAGNFKALLPPGSHLSIPAVRLRRRRGLEAGPEGLATPPEACIWCQSVFHTAFGDCCLTLEA